MKATLEPRSKDAIVADLQALAAQPGFVYVLAFLIRRDLFVDPRETVNINWFERLSFQELAFLCGLLLKQSISWDVPAYDAAKQWNLECVRLFEELHRAYIEPTKATFFQHHEQGLTTEDKQAAAYQAIFASGDFMAEAIFYASTGAYDFQYLSMAERRYERDRAWLEADRALDMRSACRVVDELKKLGEHKVKVLAPNPATFQEQCQSLIDAFSFTPSELTSVAPKHVESVLRLFACDPGDPGYQTLGLPGDFNLFEAKPIVRIGQDRYFLPIGFFLSQSLYESPFYWMLASNAYRDTGLQHRGDATADMATAFLQPVFGANRVFTNVRVVSGKQTVSDIDVLAFAGNKAIVIQAKSKRLTALSRKGDITQLKSDFAKAVQEAYDQGLVCRHAILHRSHRLESDAGAPLVLDEAINEVYVICVTADPYPSLAHQSEVFLQRPAGEPYPICVSLFDLEVLTCYLTDPFEFLYYIRQRIATAGYFKAENEIGLLAYHLGKKLWPTPNIPFEPVPQQLAQRIDANFQVLRGAHPHTPAADKLRHTWKNPAFTELVGHLKASRVPGLTDALFLLYDLSSKAIDGLIAKIAATKVQCQRDGRIHDFSLLVTRDFGISFLCRSESDRLPGHTLNAARAKKYQTRSKAWIGLGSFTASTQVIDFVCFNQEPWTFDASLETLAKTLKPGRHERTGKKIGRNEPCVCGSTLKFKHCCGK